jgi:putative hemolysin
MLALELGVVACLIVLNGFFAMAELALVSSRRPRLAAMAEKGSAGAGAALRLLDNQARFLSSVQIGITLIGVLAGAFGGATLAEDLAGWLQTLGVRPGTAETVAVAVVVAVITYFSLIVGELVPKQVALADPERVAAFAAPAMAALARLAAPWSGCSSSPRAWSCACSGATSSRSGGSPRRRSGCWSPRASARARSSRRRRG